MKELTTRSQSPFYFRNNMKSQSGRQQFQQEGVLKPSSLQVHAALFGRSWYVLPTALDALDALLNIFSIYHGKFKTFIFRGYHPYFGGFKTFIFPLVVGVHFFPTGSVSYIYIYSRGGCRGQEYDAKQLRLKG